MFPLCSRRRWCGRRGGGGGTLWAEWPTRSLARYTVSAPRLCTLLGNIGYTTVASISTYSGSIASREDIYGPFEAGFGA